MASVAGLTARLERLEADKSLEAMEKFVSIVHIVYSGANGGRLMPEPYMDRLETRYGGTLSNGQTFAMREPGETEDAFIARAKEMVTADRQILIFTSTAQELLEAA